MFRKVLVANRGEIALRVIRACREMGIATVAVHSDVDRESLHVKMADESVCIGPAESRESYLSVQRILAAAEVTNADAIHPGYGFLAENAEFARVCEKCGVAFIGPTAANIDSMGDKLSAREAMKQAGLPMMPGIEVDVDDAAKAASVAQEIGLPVIVKATAGGGGKGIKVVRSMEQLWNTLKAAKSEAQAAFGNSRVYIERYLEEARHIEFQVAADGNGNVVHFGERDCSIQRRYQKVLEESPSPAVPADVRRDMGKIVTDAIRSIGYRNLGTVEFLMDPQKRFYFLEMNTRIQVEHPITEEVVGIDLVKLQLRLAAGDPLPVRQEDIRMQGHAMEMRINAEDPEKFYPSAGQITAYHVPGGRGIRVDSGAYDGYAISPYYDSMIAKLIVHGVDRPEAIAKGEVALREFLIEGIHSNIPLHQRILSNPEFRSGTTSVTFLSKLLNLKY
ncbi:MAG TPA: acetyl-CoA carboxylase biotin carboxylase subunit [Bdellovibrionota bacterium]|nr:acetyl-CoA carboxylase biotin carboxylase subunit [Bdellovibrionota bacterium]